MNVTNHCQNVYEQLYIGLSGVLYERAVGFLNLIGRNVLSVYTGVVISIVRD